MRLVLLIFLLIYYLRAEDDEVENTNLRLKRNIRCARRSLAAKNATRQSRLGLGEVCCDSELETIIREAIESPTNSLREIAHEVQKRAQENHYHAFEVITSKKDFVVNSYYNGQTMCKLRSNDFFILIYQTPTKYDIDDNFENWLTRIDSQGQFRDIRVDPLADINSGTWCMPGIQKREGNKCCSRLLYFMISKVLDEVSTSPVFNSSFETPGVVANMIKRRIQKRFNKLFEIIVSRMDFGLASYSFTDLTCKLFMKDLYVLAYETPFQTHFDIENIEYELGYSIISQEEILGTNSYMLPGQKVSTGIELESNGYRIGWPKDSHCDHQNKRGSKCCHMELFHSMYDSVMYLKSDDSFAAVNRREIAKHLRKQAELAINQPLEIIVSNDDFIVASNHEGGCVCKFKADDYHIMAWRVPGNYSIGQDFYADNGREDFFGCGRDRYENITLIKNRFKREKNIKIHGGNDCCNRTLRYTLKKNFQSAMEAKGLDAQELSRTLARMTQAQYDSQVEVIVSKSFFEFKSSGKRKMDTCKVVEMNGFNIQIFETGGKPDPNEFLNSDVALSTINDENRESGIEDSNTNSDINVNSQSDTQNGLDQISQQNSQAENQAEAQQQALQMESNQIQQFQRVSIIQPEQQVIQPRLQQEFASEARVPVAPMIDNNLPPVPLFAAGMCFSGESFVFTDRGKKKMADLEVGDFVLTTDDNQVFFQPVALWLHREPESDGGYIEFKTESNKTLHISPKHLIYYTSCQENKFNVTTLPISGEVFAYEVLVGECFYLYERERWSFEKIVDRQMVKKRGLFAPLTNNGKIIVNGFLASCFTDFTIQPIQRTYFGIMSNVEKQLNGLKSWLGFSAEFVVEKPYLFKFYEELLYNILPTKFYYS